MFNKEKNEKKLKKFFLLISLFSSVTPCLFADPLQAITYFWGGGRFGDKIISYTTAKWISYKYDIPLLLKPFEYSAMLRLGKEEKKFSKEILEQYGNTVIPINSGEDIAEQTEDAIFESRGGYFDINGSTFIEEVVASLLEDKPFMKELKYMLQPVVAPPEIKLPSDKITVAVHIRKGGGYDQALSSMQYYKRSIASKRFYADKRWPQKFPPEQYYADQIKNISCLFDDKPLFVFIFTDDRNPAGLVNRIRNEVNKSNITYDCRKRGNFHRAHVVEDFYNIARFDCLIRSSSSFAIAAQLLGNHKLVIYPKYLQWEGSKLLVDEVAIVDNRET